MALSVFLGIWSEDKLRRVRVDDLDFEAKVDSLRPHLTKELGEQACNSYGQSSPFFVELNLIWYCRTDILWTFAGTVKTIVQLRGHFWSDYSCD